MCISSYFFLNLPRNWIVTMEEYSLSYWNLTLGLPFCTLEQKTESAIVNSRSTNADCSRKCWSIHFKKLFLIVTLWKKIQISGFSQKLWRSSNSKSIFLYDTNPHGLNSKWPIHKSLHCTVPCPLPIFLSHKLVPEGVEACHLHD